MSDLRIAWMNLILHRRRASALAAAIGGVSCLFVMLASLLAGVEHSTLQVATTLTSGHINIGGFYKPRSNQAALLVTDHEPVVALARRLTPEAELITERGRGWGRIVSDDGTSLATGLAGIELAAEPHLHEVLQLADGQLTGLKRPDGLLLFQEHARKLGVHVGDTVTVTTTTAAGVANTIDCHVVAVAKELGALSRVVAYLSRPAWRALYQADASTTGAVHLLLRPGSVAELEPLVTRLRDGLRQAGYRVLDRSSQPTHLKLEAATHESWTGQTLDVTTWQDDLPFMVWTLKLLRGLSFLLVVVLSFIMLGGVMNALATAIRERTREIGTLRALGMQRSGVARLFLLEAALLGALGASLGAALAALLSLAINAASVSVPLAIQLFLMRNTLQLALEPRIVLTSILMITVATSAAAVLPSLRAARRRPVDAMAHFG